MSLAAYTYSVLRYVHNASVGEALNVGVVLYAPSVPYLSCRVEHRYARLSQTFSEFDGEHFRRTMRRFEGAIEQLRSSWRGVLPSLHSLPDDLDAIRLQIWPDEDLSFRFGPILAGVTPDLARTLETLFHRFVTSQAPRNQTERRTDEQVWSVYQKPLAREAVSKVLHPKTFATPEFELQFRHAFKNEHWHVLQPVSLDYVTPDALQNKATKWLGNAVALQGHPDLGKLYLLLGPPQLQKNQRAYRRAKDLLDKMPVEHELIEEDEAEDFAKEIAGYIQEHGVLEVP